MTVLGAGVLLFVLVSPALAQTAAPAQPQQAPDRFFISAIDIVGVTELSNEEIERIVYPHLGPDRTGADVTAVQSELQAAYQAKGYNAVERQLTHYEAKSQI
ncbi:POTRA domain-containing protein [Asticcacaulis benevestitus]|uniref:Polypeptide-transport-associated ShlB-type domain-containing protein n=1 Tax=Asticcacaulis benevestitus DSM 16100 = ATCC BAA-896 TaxID=1121022 RepID=V4PD21_9CAUL|nr:POTRA domain-containing protein [Asticcacaulis benevestitus]ESQ91827.1 hypothetical protein ABENE_09345 [Asticcacaulis benevestitus DSM 16100 = ATCC BAA-896]